MYEAGVMANHNAGPLARWLSPRVEDERRTVPTSREEREGFFRFWSLLYLPKMEVASSPAPPGRRGALLRCPNSQLATRSMIPRSNTTPKPYPIE